MEPAIAFASPGQAVGERIIPHQAQFRKVATKGKTGGGRHAEVQPRSFVDPKTLVAGQRITLPLMDGEQVEGTVNLVKPGREGWTRAGGALLGGRIGSFVLASNGTQVSALIMLPKEGLAYEVNRERDGRTLMVERPLSDVLCYELPLGDDEPPGAKVAEATPTVPIYNSRPDATEVIYLDFDGERVVDGIWNDGVPIDAAAYDLPTETIWSIFQRVKEDWIPFDVNVTTDPARYWNAPPGHRMRCIITPTTEWFSPTDPPGGVAMIGSFRLVSSNQQEDIPCWVFHSDPDKIAHVISHELGHTMGLSHDGRTKPAEQYYRGNGSWRPIMGGSGDYSMTIQWSKGEYPFASQLEDDLEIISAPENHFGYAQDLAGDTFETAAALTVSAPGSRAFVTTPGVIERNTDSDCYRFATNGGTARIQVAPASNSPNLMLGATIFDAGGSVIHTEVASAPWGTFYYDSELPPGVYYLRVFNSGYERRIGTNTEVIFTSYGSIGEFKIYSSIPNQASTLAITSPAAAKGTKGVYFTYPIKATGNPTAFDLTGELPAGLSFDPLTGVISGIPNETGDFSLTLAVTNVTGTSTAPLALKIVAEPVSLSAALDFESLAWTSGEAVPWVGQFLHNSDGTDAAQSGVVDHGQTSYFETTVTGPVEVSWKWKVSSESNADFLAMSIDGEELAKISGETDWASATASVLEGSHTLRWAFRRNELAGSGLNLGWVDAVTFTTTEVPVITSLENAAGTVGESFNFSVAASNFPTQFAVTSCELPPGLTLHSASGRIEGWPAVAGTYEVTVEASNANGAGPGNLQLVIAPSLLTVGQVLEQESVTWAVSGERDWFPQTQVKFSGAHALQAGPIGAGQSSTVTATVQAPQSIYFWWKTDCESGTATTGDSLNFLVEGEVVATLSGPADWRPQTIYVDGTGPKTISWTYRKDAETSSGADTAWLDKVVITTDLLPVVSAATVNGREGDAFSHQIVATNSPDYYEADGLPAGLTLNPQSGIITGTPTVTGSFPVTLRAVNQAGAGAAILTLELGPPRPPVGVAVDAENLVWASNGTARWFWQEDESHDGVDAARSGPVGDNQISILESRITGPAVVSFYWRTDSQGGSGNSGDMLRFAVNGVTDAFIRGKTTWARREITLLAGEFLLQWTYAKDAAGKAGEDAGWVDQVTIDRTPFAPVIRGPLTARGFVGRSFRYQIDALNSPTDYVVSGLPAGLDYDAASGVISGSPENVGTASVLLSATNAIGTGSATLELEMVAETAGTDRFANATAITGGFVRSKGSSDFTSAEAGEPAIADQAAAASLWWQWTAPYTGEVSVTTEGSDFNTRLAVFTGTALADLTLVKANDNAGRHLSSAVKFKAAAGQTYFVAVDGVAGSTGNVVLNISYTATGKYAGIVRQPGGAAKGLLNVSLTGKQTFSGAFQLGKKKHSFKGSFVDGVFSGTISRGRGIVPISLHLVLNLEGGEDRVDGTAEVDGVIHPLILGRAVGKADVPTSLPGAFTFFVEPGDTTTAGLPRGFGYGTVVIDKSGNTKTAGRLGDGTKFSFGTPLRGDGSWPFYVAPYRGDGWCGGEISLDRLTAGPSLSGALSWFKMPDPKSAQFPGGFPAGIEVALKGSRYAKPVAGQTIIPVSSISPNLDVFFYSSDVLVEPLATGFLSDRNKFSSESGSLKMTFTTSSGLFSGSFKKDGKTHSFGGAVVLEVDPNAPSGSSSSFTIQGRGLFFGLTETGTVELHPTPSATGAP